MAHGGERRRRRGVTVLAVTMLALLAARPALARDKTDLVVLVNGDSIHGEIKELSAGRIRLSTDSLDTVYVKWVDVVSLHSEYYFQMEDTRGRVFYGTLAPSEQEGSILIRSLTGPVDLGRSALVRITPIEQAWKECWNGAIGFGFSYTKASAVSTYNLNSTATYRVRKYKVQLSFDSTLTTQTDRPTVSRNDAAAAYTRFRKNRWLNTWVAGAQTNSELGLDLRVYAGALGGRNVIQTNAASLSLQAGLIASEEALSGDTDSQTNLESIFGLRHEYDRYKTPKANLYTTLAIFPGLTDWGRVRAEFSTNLSYELFKDFYVQFSAYLSYDSKPPSEDASSEADWGGNIGLSWKF